MPISILDALEHDFQTVYPHDTSPFPDGYEVEFRRLFEVLSR